MTGNRLPAPVVALAFAALLPANARAVDYYVDAAGLDSNAGTASAPWATLQHAVESIQPGDGIVVRRGTYAGCRIELTCDAAAPCTLRSETTGTALVNAAGPRNRHQSHIEVENFSGTTRYWTIEGFEVAGSSRYGIDLRDTEHVTVRRCTVHDSVVTGIFTAYSYDPLIEDNESYNNGEHGIYQSNSGDNPVIRLNRLHHNHACGLHMNGDASLAPPGDGQISFALVERNTIWENGTGGGSGINMDGVSDSIIRNNLLYDNHASGIAAYAIDGARGSSRNLIYNNTIVMPAGSRNVILIPSASPGTPNPTDNKVKNNILYTAALRGAIATWAPAVPGFESDYNIVVDRFSADDDNSTIAFAAWQALGHDAHSFLATPDELFVDAAGGDYHLKAGSRAEDAGVALPGVTEDLEGAPRPAGAGFDIGCYEAPSSAPRAGPVVHLYMSGTEMTWDAAANATVYDIIHGDIGALRAAGTLADASCLVDDCPTTTRTEPGVPAPGQGFYYLVRGDAPGVPAGTYDASNPARDGEVGADCADLP